MSRSALASALLLAFLLAQAAAAAHLYAAFPSSWSWGELLVDYAGGMTKRGLVGALAHAARGWVSPRVLLTGLVFAAYAAASALMLLRFRMAERFPGLLFLFSPLGWLFPLLVPSAFGRKDVFVVLAVLAGLAAVTRPRAGLPALLWAGALFAVVGLATEIAWLYFPLLLAAWLFRARAEPAARRLAAAAVGLAYVALCLGLTLCIGHVDTAAISASWAPLPLPDGGASALCCLNFSLRDAMGVAGATRPNLGGYALAEAYGLVPLVLLLAEGHGAFRDPLGLAMLLGAAALATGPVFVAADWGRYLYLWTACVFATAWTVCRAGAAAGEEAVWWSSEPLLKALFVLVYATTWQTVHYQYTDRSAFIPGLASRAIGASTIAPFTK